jgi:hypothetical protein
MPGPHGVPRTDIIALLREGHSDREIGRRLRTNPKRVGRIRTELGLPQYQPTQPLTLEQAWTAQTEQLDDGHMRWTGYHREGTCPVLKHRGIDYTARRVAFLIAHGREPQGRVLPGCGWQPCVAPEHVEDQPMRARLNTQVAAIFGGAA